MMKQSSMQSDAVKMAALFFALSLLLIWLPAVGIFLAVLIPFPIAFFTYKYELNFGIGFGLVAFFLLYLITGVLSLFLFLLLVVPGVVLGELYRRDYPAFGVFAGTALSTVGAVVILYLGAMLLFDVDLVGEFQEAMTESAEMSEQLLMITDGGATDAMDGIYELIEHIPVIAPALIVIFGVGFAFITQIATGGILRKQGFNAGRFPPLRDWYFSKAFIWYYLLMYMFILMDFDQGTAVHTVVSNLRPILETVMVIQGFALIFYYFYNKGKTMALPLAIMIVTLLFPLFLQIVRILGIIDLGFDLRKRMSDQG
ncbi:YybS family protein [Salisediminibacterium halotolerans]|nr:DUF2232 domain-containing protein [Salisediminibacterium haloalkalitolerans]